MIKVTRVIGLALTGTWEEVREEAALRFPLEFPMPCGRVYRFESERDIPPADQPCGCGGTEPFEHWVVKHYEPFAPLGAAR